MRNCNTRLYAFFFAALLPVTVCLSCNKLINDLIPPNEQKLIGLNLKNVDRYVCSTDTDISGHAVTVTVPKGTDVTRLLPEAVISPQATLFPVTLRYLQEAFPATDVLKLTFALESFENTEMINKWFFDLYAENPGFNIPQLVFPINFLSPVPFAVIGGRGKIELYTVKVLYDDGSDPAAEVPTPEVPVEKDILSFSVGEPQTGQSVIGTNTIGFVVKAETEVRALTVTATVSPNAILIPITESYLVPLLQRLGMDPLSVISGFITASNKEAYLRTLFAPVNLSHLTVPLDKPIDFTNPVQFAVLGKDKEVKLYTATCWQTATNAALKGLGFSKVKNPALVKDGKVSIDKTAKTVTAELFYPIEYTNTGAGAFSLYCDAAYSGDSAVIEYKGTRYKTIDPIPFMPENPSGSQYHFGSAEAKLIITFGTEQTEYRLLISFTKDPDAVPPEKNILSFSVGKPQIGESVIGANTVDFEVTAGTEVRALTVTAIVSQGAIPIPFTEPYLVPLLRSLGMEPFSVIAGFSTASDKEAYLNALFAPIDISHLTVPLDKPVDFTNPVQFAVLGKDKEVKLYTATCGQTVTGAVLKNFGFSKVKNPGLVKDGTVRIDRTAKTVTAELLYPVEYTGSGAFSLYCDAAYAGDSAAIEYEGTRYNAADKIPFRPENPSGAQYHLGTAEAKIIITFGTEQTEYRLLISFAEDPDTVRSITDFRFTKDKNSELKTLSMAAIANDGHEGTITATVLYTGSAKPESLIPTFITPGTVTVNGAVQTSGSSAQDFRKTLAYICTSRNGQYTRRYTVKIRFVYAEPSQSLLKTFRFPAGVNPLIGDSEGRIDQTAHTVHITARYAGERPKKLIPEFSATGEVTVDGLTQSSGFSAQDFEYPVYYKVTDPDDPQTYTIYAVTVHFEYSADSGCELMEFLLLQQDNPSLTQDVTAFISAHSGAVYALLPRGADVTNLIPRFTARGRVTVDGVEQTSGETAADFSSEVEYKVTSENGLQTKTYRVTLQQAGGIIYVDPKATGRHNGSTWEDAFTNLEAALQKANEMPDGVTAEIWMSKDCTLNNKRYELKRTLTLRGGFLGIETEADQRNKDNKTVFLRERNDPDDIFFSDTVIHGTLTFDGIEFNKNGFRPVYPLYYIKWDIAGENALVIENCTVRWATDFNTSISSRLASVTIKDSEASSDIKLPKCDTVTVQNVNIVATGTSNTYLSIRCDTAAVDNYRGALYINSYFGTEPPAQKVVIKNSRCDLEISAKDIDVSNSTIYGKYKSFDVISLYRLLGYYNMELSPAASASIKMKNCDFGNISIKNDSSEVLKLKNVDITAVTMGFLYVKTGGKVITERLSCSKEWYNDDTIGSLKLPACSVTIKNCKCTDTIDVSCNAKDFKAIMEAVPVHTDIEDVSAKTIKCGYITEDLRTIKREYSCPPYVLKTGDWKKIYVEPVPFASGGSHSLKDVKAENLYVSSGDSITLKGGSVGYQPFRLKGQLKGSLSFFGRWSEEQQLNLIYNACDYSSVVLNNETTPNSTIDIDNIYVEGEWFRARTKTLSARKILPVWYQMGCLELQGHSSVTAADCNFRNLVPFYVYCDQKPTNIYPSFLAVGGTVSLTGCTFDESFVQVASGTCFDTHLNSWFNCTAAVWKK